MAYYKLTKISFLVLIPIIGFAMSTEKEKINVQVISSETRVHHRSGRAIFAYTHLLFVRVDGRQMTYECVQRGKICPLMESGKTYSAEREGDAIYFWMGVPEEKEPVRVKYKEFSSS